MSKKLILTAAIAVLFCMISGGVSADRVVLIPTGTTLGTAGIKAEYANNSDGDGTILWANVGISRFEIEGARFMDYGLDDTDVFSVQAAVIPETSFTPALALGIRNIGDEHAGLPEPYPEPYNEQSFYAVASKTLPLTESAPGLLGDAVVHGGVGTGGLSGFFFGLEATIVPVGVRASLEYDTDDWNWAVSYGFASIVRAKIYSIKDDIFYGFSLSTGF